MIAVIIGKRGEVSNKLLYRILDQLEYSGEMEHYFLQGVLGIRDKRRFVKAIDLLEKAGYVVVSGDNVKLASVSALERFRRNKDFALSERNEWIRFWITTGLAAFASVISAIALCETLGVKEIAVRLICP